MAFDGQRDAAGPRGTSQSGRAISRRAAVFSGRDLVDLGSADPFIFGAIDTPDILDGGDHTRLLFSRKSCISSFAYDRRGVRV